MRYLVNVLKDVKTNRQAVKLMNTMYQHANNTIPIDLPLELSNITYFITLMTFSY